MLPESLTLVQIAYLRGKGFAWAGEDEWMSRDTVVILLGHGRG
jgi:hypothetical protein